MRWTHTTNETKKQGTNKAPASEETTTNHNASLSEDGGAMAQQRDGEGKQVQIMRFSLRHVAPHAPPILAFMGMKTQILHSATYRHQWLRSPTPPSETLCHAARPPRRSYTQKRQSISLARSLLWIPKAAKTSHPGNKRKSTELRRPETIPPPLEIAYRLTCVPWQGSTDGQFVAI